MSLSNIRNEGIMNGELTDADDEILETLVKTATKTSSTRAAPRERKRTRHADRKSRKYLLSAVEFIYGWWIGNVTKNAKGTEFR